VQYGKILKHNNESISVFVNQEELKNYYDENIIEKKMEREVRGGLYLINNYDVHQKYPRKFHITCLLKINIRNTFFLYN